jgi:hypothetical protein
MSNPYRYVWDLVRTDIVGAEDEDVYCPHQRWSVYKEPPYCHDCMQAGLARLVAEGALDDEILPAFSTAPIPERGWMESTLAALRSDAAASPQPEPTSVGRPEWPLWEAMIEARDLLRSSGKQGTQQEVADHLRCDLKTVKRRARRNGGWPRS